MARWMKTFAQPGLARKIALLRMVSAALAILVLVAVSLLAMRGELVARGSRTGGRFVSDGVVRTIAWSDGPVAYVLAASWYAAIGLLVVACVHAVAGRLIEKFHGRPLFRKKYPY